MNTVQTISTSLILLSPFICLLIIGLSKNFGVIKAFIFLLALAALDILLDKPTHAHNPLGKFTGTFLIAILGGGTLVVKVIADDIRNAKKEEQRRKRNERLAEKVSKSKEKYNQELH